MNKVMYIFSILFFLTGCAYSTQMSEFMAGQESAKNKDFQGAYDHFVKSYVAEPSASAANNAGAAAADMGNMEAAKAWFTLAARDGDASAIANLAQHGWTLSDQMPVSNQSPVAAQPSQQSNANLIAQCKSVMMVRPTKTGSYSDSLTNAAQCDADPYAHLRPQAQTSFHCVRDVTGGVTCN